jgi:hypothetical protein
LFVSCVLSFYHVFVSKNHYFSCLFCVFYTFFLLQTSVINLSQQESFNLLKDLSLKKKKKKKKEKTRFGFCTCFLEHEKVS